MRPPEPTERLSYRPPKPEDADALHIVWGDPEVMRYLPSDPSPLVSETAERVERHVTRFAETGYGLCAVVEREEGRVVGTCGLFPVEWVGPEVEVAYHLARDVWNRGYATEAAGAWVAAAFDQLELERVVALAYPANKASIRVMEKIGMRFDRDVAKYGERLVQYAIERPDVRGHSVAAPDPTAFRSGLLPVEHFDRRFSADNLEFWVPVLVREARIDSDTDVLDVGCGTGGFARAIAAATSARVTGCEQAPHFVEFARAAAEDDAVAVTWVVGDAEALPFAASSFDRVLLSLVLHQLSEPRSAVAEAFRALRPGGLVLVRTIAPEDVPSRVPERFVPSMAAADAARMPALKTIRGWLERAGFVDVDLRRHLRNKVLELGAQEAALQAEVTCRYGFITQEEVAEGLRRMRQDASRAEGRWVDPRPTYTIVAKRPG